MPPQIGKFISDSVYNGLLQSWNEHPIQDILACQFIDVSDGSEAFDKSSSSFKVFFLYLYKNYT